MFSVKGKTPSMIGQEVAERVIPGAESSDESVAGLGQGKLLHVDFWPTCLQAQEGFTDVQFERFE